MSQPPPDLRAPSRSPMGSIRQPPIRLSHTTPATDPTLLQLMAFKKGIRRDVSVYPVLKDEKYYDAFQRRVKILAKSHECSEVLDPDFTPHHSDQSRELFEHKQVFMFSVFENCLLTDMGKTIVRRYVHSTNAQQVWIDLTAHMKKSSKGASEKRRLNQYITTTVLDSSYRGTTKQFVLHFQEQFRQLDDISEADERIPMHMRLTLLQNAVKAIPDLRIVETLEEYQSVVGGHGSTHNLNYTTYYDLLINACIHYDESQSQKPVSTKQTRSVHQSDSEYSFMDEDTLSDSVSIDTPGDEFIRINTAKRRPTSAKQSPNKQVHNLNSNAPPPKSSNRVKSYDGPIFLLTDIYKMLTEQVTEALKTSTRRLWSATRKGLYTSRM